MADEIVYDERGFNVQNGMHFNGTEWNDNDWNVEGVHRLTGTHFGPDRRTSDGERYDSDGYNWQGYDRAGYDHEGYDEDGYDSSGLDDCGNSRCDNGVCEDWSCECHSDGNEFENHLDEYSTCVVEAHDWEPKSSSDRTLYAGNEIEMYSNGEDTDDVDYVKSQIDRLYRACNPQTRTKKATIATADGSLDYKPGGFEIKIVPLTRAQMYHIFSKIEILGDRRCSAWTCGLEVGHHIHLSRKALTELTIGKMGVFLNDPFNRPFLEHVAGRGPTYSHFENGKTVKCRRSGHGNVFNTGGYATVELRMFRSNLRGTGILKNYDFAIASVAFCQDVDYRRSSIDWQKFLKWMAGNYAAYPNLHEFLKRPSYVADVYLPLLPKNARRTGGLSTEMDAA